MRIKKHENLTKANIAKVIELLEQEKPITKKEACSILNITYNTTRLGKIIDEHKLDIERTSRMKAKLRGKPATDDDIRFVIQRYLTGENVSSSASSMYRSPAFVKNIITRLGVPEKMPKNYNNRKEILLPEECIAEEFQVGEKVWLPKENYFGIIKREHTLEYQKSMAGLGECNYLEKYGARGYQVDVLTPCDLSKTMFPWLDGNKAGYQSFALAYDIGSIKHLEKYL